ncbi:MAG: hypothetical protein HZC41_03540 [Chloroflexi bacterium]|nr:hypothetical protein [Chloroflexota bacterium]
MALHEDELRKLINCIVTSHQDDCLDCESCGQQLDCLAELVAQGRSLDDLMPEVTTHLCCCRDCFEEFEALVAILRAEQGGQLDISG